MRNTRGLVVLLVAVAVVATVLFLASRRRSAPPAEPAVDQPVRFSASDVPLTSTDLRVTLEAVRGATYPSYTSWIVELVCAEPDGCAGDFEVEVRFHGGGERRRLVMFDRFDVPDTGVLRFEGMQNASVPVTDIDGVALAVRQRSRPGAPPADVID